MKVRSVFSFFMKSLISDGRGLFFIQVFFIKIHLHNYAININIISVFAKKRFFQPWQFVLKI